MLPECFEQWVVSRPSAVQARIRTHPPGIYLYLRTLETCRLHSYDERLMARVTHARFGSLVGQPEDAASSAFPFDDLVLQDADDHGPNTSDPNHEDVVGEV